MLQVKSVPDPYTLFLDSRYYGSYMTTQSSSAAGYNRPPITEAVIGITFSSPLDSSQLTAATAKLQANYPHKQDVTTVGVSVAINSANPEENKANFEPRIGHRLSTDDQTQLAVLWPDAFSLSQLAPYQDWEAFIARFERDWQILKRVLGFREIKRIGVRYINRIDIPSDGDSVKHEQFLSIYPQLPSLINVVDAYAVQTLVHLDDIDCNLTINSANVPSPVLGFISFVLDIDISSDKPPQSDADIIELLNRIRAKKNDVFEACITDHSRKLFQ